MAKDKQKEKADFEIQPTPVDFRNIFKGGVGVVIRSADDKKIRVSLPKFDIDDIDELTNARDYLDEIIEALEDDEETNEDPEDEDLDDEELDDEELGDDEDD